MDSRQIVRWLEPEECKKLSATRRVSIMIDKQLSTHEVTLYEQADGESFLLFKVIEGKKIINYLPEDYRELEKQIRISGLDIFQENEACIIPVLESYRY
ncbi:hypothetical protein [Cellulosilyticum ruminicola]|uniref:hypothetical protein n=1 Tax=Cellulosilyticum ruminicola TaxID=425254 RepID=UPI0006D0F203|nr:hypothetical protein [Cellulosilyticum ruminicola]